MKAKLETVIEKLAHQINNNTTADAAMKFTQAALNLAQVINGLRLNESPSNILLPLQQQINEHTELLKDVKAQLQHTLDFGLDLHTRVTYLEQQADIALQEQLIAAQNAKILNAKNRRR